MTGLFSKKAEKCYNCINHIHKQCNDKCKCNCQYYDEYAESIEDFEKGITWKKLGDK